MQRGPLLVLQEVARGALALEGVAAAAQRPFSELLELRLSHCAGQHDSTLRSG
jgi:hypothetical protein